MVGGGRRLEIASFVVVFAVGTALAVVGAAGGGGGTERALAAPPASPPPSSTSVPVSPPSSSVPVAPASEVVVFGEHASGTISGCTGHLTFKWAVQPPGPSSGPAVIEFTGPKSVRRFTRPVVSRRIELS